MPRGKTGTRPVRPKKENPAIETEETVVTESASDDTINDAATRDAVAQALAEKEAEIAALKKQLQGANARAKEASLSNEDYSEKPDHTSGEFFYYLVRFHPKRNANDTDDAMAAVNGDWMVWPRNKETVLRSDYREVLEHAFTPKFTVQPGQDRKDIGGIQNYTFDILRKISKEEYEKKLKEGNAQMKASIAMSGD